MNTFWRHCKCQDTMQKIIAHYDEERYHHTVMDHVSEETMYRSPQCAVTNKPLKILISWIRCANTEMEPKPHKAALQDQDCGTLCQMDVKLWP
jgi:hypothetical protein